MTQDERIIELHILLIFMTGWEEQALNKPGKQIFKAWKGYPLEILDEMEARKWIHNHCSSGHLLLTPKGKRIARALKLKYLPT